MFYTILLVVIRLLIEKIVFTGLAVKGIWGRGILKIIIKLAKDIYC